MAPLPLKRDGATVRNLLSGKKLKSPVRRFFSYQLTSETQERKWKLSNDITQTEH
jgi:hypothetical protein